MATALLLRLFTKLLAGRYVLRAAQASRRDSHLRHALVALALLVRIGLPNDGFRNVLRSGIENHFEVRVVCDKCALYRYVVCNAKVLSV
jgi:hypothetical protein